MKKDFLDKVLERIDRIDAGSLQAHFLRLARERGLLETIFQAIQEGVVVLNDKGQLEYANRASQKLLGFRFEEAEGQPVSRFLRGVDWGRLMRLDAGEWSRMVKREIEISYPEHRYLEFYVVPLQVVDAKERGAVVILRDVTREREQTESSLESARLNAITLLAAGVAHEIGNPLNSLNIHLQLMEREVAALPREERDALKELLGVARDEVVRLDQIITRFLGAIRPSEPKFEPVALRELLEETIRFMKKEAEDRGAWIELDSPDDLPPVQLDKAQMRQVFYNLIRNAIQSMTSGGLLKITVREAERVVSLAFRDTGCGMTPEALGTVYEPFRTTKKEGTGLGLMIVQRILRDHGGQMEIDTEPGKGTVVTLYLPREQQRIRLLESSGEKPA